MNLRKYIACSLTLLLLAVALPLGAGTHTQTVTKMYNSTAGVRVIHGIQGVYTGLATQWCVLDNVDPALSDQYGCIGGGQLHTHPATSGYCAANPTECHTYLKASSTIADTLSGPNVQQSLCIFNPGGGNTCEGSQQGEIDGFPDAAAIGCGVTLTADATGIHDGNHHATVFAWTLFVDPATTTTCVGTQGTISVLFFTA